MTDRIDAVLSHPETILYGGTVRTVDEEENVEAVAIRDGRILNVGDADAIRDLAGPETTGRDLEGKR